MSAEAVPGWDFAVTYVYSAALGTVTYTTDGALTNTISCSGTWSIVHDETTSTTDSRHVVQYALDYDTGQVLARNITDFVDRTTVAECSSFSLPTANSVFGWQSFTGTSSGGCLVQIASAYGPDLQTGGSVSTTWTMYNTDDGVCGRLDMAGSVPPVGRIPFSGRIQMTIGDTTGISNGKSAVVFSSCLLIMGICTDSAPPVEEHWGECRGNPCNQYYWPCAYNYASCTYKMSTSRGASLGSVFSASNVPSAGSWWWAISVDR